MPTEFIRTGPPLLWKSKIDTPRTQDLSKIDEMWESTYAPLYRAYKFMSILEKNSDEFQKAADALKKETVLTPEILRKSLEKQLIPVITNVLNQFKNLDPQVIRKIGIDKLASNPLLIEEQKLLLHNLKKYDYEITHFILFYLYWTNPQLIPFKDLTTAEEESDVKERLKKLIESLETAKLAYKTVKEKQRESKG